MRSLKKTGKHRNNNHELLLLSKLNIQTSKISIDKKTYDSLLENWSSTDQVIEDPNLLDSGIVSSNKSMKVTLRIPWQLSGGNGHMLIKANLLFIQSRNQIALAILCHLTKPLIISAILGFLTTLIFVFPYFLFSQLSLIYTFLIGIVISAIYFGLLCLKIQRISTKYLKELKKKYT